MRCLDDAGGVTALTAHDAQVLRFVAAELTGVGRICRLTDRLETRAGQHDRDDETTVLVMLLAVTLACAGAVALLVYSLSTHHLDEVAAGAGLLVAVGATMVRLAA